MSFDTGKFVHLSRDRNFLLKSAIFLVILTLMICGCLTVMLPPVNGILEPETPRDETLHRMGADIDPDLDATRLAAVIRNREQMALEIVPPDFREIRIFQSGEDSRSPDYDSIRRRIESSTRVSEGERERLLLLHDALHRDDEARDTAIAGLRALPENRFRNEFLGDALLAAEQPEEGIRAYAREGEKFPDATYSQRSALIAYMERKEVDPLIELLAKPGFRETLSDFERIEASSLTRDFGQLFIDIARLDLNLLRSPHLFTALFTAAIWFLILALMGNLNRSQYGWSFLALILGGFSTTLTLYAVYLQEDFLYFRHHPEDTVTNQLIAMVAGVGLREETLKLLCYLPVALLTLKYRNGILALVTAAMTGLGFAMMENIQYFSNSPDGYTAWARLLSANALHFCLTGTVGYSLYHCLVNRGRRWENFLIEFLLAVLIHGFYNSLIIIPELFDYNLFTLVLLVISAYHYLDLVRDQMPMEGRLRRVSPLGVFVLGCTLLACGIMLISIFQMNMVQAFGAFLNAIGGTLPMAFAFISRLRDL